jgi:16S rRNA A1518/A1519 N6-dimethyltransferase RsmA/KsgA/DIM1 with predicted DNA glycosylase/AP lyase activity
MDLVQKMLSMAETKPGEAVYDLGSGDGRIIITAAREFHAKSVGVEINPLWVLWTQLKVSMLKLEEQVEIVWGDFFRKDLGEADVVTVFLRQDTNDKLRPKLEREMKEGARVVSYTYPFTGWNPLKADRESEIFVYRIGTER